MKLNRPTRDGGSANASDESVSSAVNGAAHKKWRRRCNSGVVIMALVSDVMACLKNVMQSVLVDMCRHNAAAEPKRFKCCKRMIREKIFN